MLTLAFDKNHMSKYIKYIYVLIFFFSTISNSYAACQPKFTLPEFPINNSSNQDLKNKVYVWYDASLSMSGFTKSQTDEINLYGPVINSLQKASQSLGTETSYNTFGSRFQTIDENRASLVTTQEFYKCTQSAQACAQKDRVNGISKVLNVAKKNQDSTVIIVTDLFLSTSETLAKNAEKIKSPLREIFNNGQSVGVFGISSSFNGKISGIPTGDGLGYASYSKATKRPFYIIVIGSGENINFIREKLENNQKLQDKLAEEPDAYHFSMITSNVIQTNLNLGLAHFDSDAFDYVVLSLTLQAMRNPEVLLKEMMRVGKQGIVTFPNFAHWRNRWQIAVGGKMPESHELPHKWYDTPNIHLCTIRDFHSLCVQLGFQMEASVAVGKSGKRDFRVRTMPNLFGEIALCRFSKTLA